MLDWPSWRHARSKNVLVTSFLLVLVALSNSAVAWPLEQLPVAQIVGVQAPSGISRSEDFSVVISVDYSRSYSTDIAILDAETGFVVASKGLIIPAGRNDFAFQLTGLDTPCVWMLLATVRVWWHEGWYANEKGATFPFQIMISDLANVTLVIMSNTVQNEVKVDGVSHSLPLQGIEISTTRGPHTIEIEPTLTVGEGTRAVFDSWSDGIRSFSRTIYLTDSLDLSATYLTEYHLTVESRVGRAVGTGWYPAGMNATFAVFDSDFTSHSSTGHVPYKFNYWSGDSDSNSPIGWLVLDGPKTVVANWSEDDSQTRTISELGIASTIFLVCSVILVAVGVVLRRRTNTEHRSHVLGGNARFSGFILILTVLVAMANPSLIQPAQAFVPIQPESVAIGDAAWYHWNRATSDTLLIWLGGGIVEPTTLLINPYEFESYNTIRFIQDLAKYYDVLALERGSMRYVDSTLNRTMFREPYPGSDNFMKRIRLWAVEHEYAYLYVVGYSVGAMAAAKELTLVSPEDWASPDGLIIITTRIAEGVSSRASSLRASLLLLYGDKVAPEFIASGKAFYENAPEEGWRDGSWYHREYHMISDVEHEVWTIRDTGEYDGRAVLLTVGFIETCKSLQFERTKDVISRIALNHTGTPETHPQFNVEVVSVHAPSKVSTEEAIRITAQVRYDLPSNSTVALVAFDTDARSIVSAAERRLSARGEVRLITTALSGESSRTAHLSLILLTGEGGNWSVVADSVRDLTIDVTDSFSARILVGYPDVAVQFDGQAFRTGTNGEVTLNATAGKHVVWVPPVVMLGGGTRAVFEDWNVTSDSSTLRLSISRDICLLAIYRRQHYLNINSSFGDVSGAGWYDENSVALFHVEPAIVALNELHVFVGWSGDFVDSSPASGVIMNAPKHVEASWKDVESQEGNDTPFQLRVFFIASLATLFAGLIFVVMSFRHGRRSRQADLPQQST